jgi:hypothetical protein
MFNRMKGKTIPVLLLTAVFALGIFASGCEGPSEDMWEPTEPREIEEEPEK